MEPFKKRQKNICKLLRDSGFDKAIIGNPMSIKYLTGIYIIPYERFYGMVIDSTLECFSMIVPSVDKGCMEGKVDEINYQDSDGPLEAIKTAVKECKVLAVDKKYFSMERGDIFQNLGCMISDIGTFIDKLRMYKDEKEIGTIQHAANIVDKALYYIADKVKPGMTEKELKMMLYTYMSKYPGFVTDEFIILVLAAENSANPHGSSGDFVFKYGDVILLDFCAYYDYYWSDITRCLFIGEVGDPKLEEIYNIVLNANLAAIATVKPGIPAKEVDKAARDYINNAGYGEYFFHRTGHGLGLSVHEEPYITSVNDLVLEEGMTFTIEPGIYLDGIGGIRIEDDILVTKDGCRVLTSYPKNLQDNILKVKI
jgi:Xaa-Pro aminopeptidase